MKAPQAKTFDENLIRQWHPSKNGAKKLVDFTTGSGQKVWWKCPMGDDHIWQSTIRNRVKGSGCPVCAGQKLTPANSLALKNPKLVNEWHPTKNGNLTPYDVFPSSKKKIWWKCPNGDDHEWESSTNNRNNGKGCPICVGIKVAPSTSLARLYPDLARQWHPNKNGSVTPNDVSVGVGKKFWWKCPKGDDHEWIAAVGHRTNGTGCPKCNPAYSIPELRIFSELRTIFPDILHRARLQKIEIDIFIPTIKVGIEFDGVYWHGPKVDKDRIKFELLSKEILLIRVREEGLEINGPLDIQVKKRKLTISDVKKILNLIIENRKSLPRNIKEEIGRYLKASAWTATEYFDDFFSKRKSVELEKSLPYLFPIVAKEWHPTKNNSLLPEHFTPGSGRKAWWVGKCKHVWLDSILHRTHGRGCPKCRYKRASNTWKKKSSKGQLSLVSSLGEQI